MFHSIVARWFCALTLSAVLVSSAFSQDDTAEPPTGDPVPTTEAPAEEPAEEAMVLGDSEFGADQAAHEGWMLTCCALVLFMTCPGLAMFYGGLVRKKNVLSVLMQCIFLMGLMTVVWALWGYSLSFGSGNAYIGNGDYLFMKGIGRYFSEAKGEIVTPMSSEVLTMFTHMLFQGMFFIITPALICGAFAERMKFSAMVVFLVLWGTLVYAPLCHWVWGGGILAYGEDGAWGGGALDFAGGTVVHISSGVSALVCAILIGPRLGFGKEPMPPHNLTYTAIGAGMLWVGWFGFNAGSQLAADGVTSSAFCATHFSAAAGAVAWAVAEWVTQGKPSVLGAASGAVAGLVCITPAAGFVAPMPALLMGLIAGVACFVACTSMKNALGYDDSLDAFGVHGFGGTVGAILTGVFATYNVSSMAGVTPDGKPNPLGLIDGNSSLIIGQIVAVLVTIVFSAVVTFILLKIIDVTIGLRVPQDGELQGLDLTEHGEEGYIFL
ncbi:MAG: Amt family ammonium transporter [Pirellulaceae bacterium]|jgi:Amt family ammonium transporter